MPRQSVCMPESWLRGLMADYALYFALYDGFTTLDGEIAYCFLTDFFADRRMLKAYSAQFSLNKAEKAALKALFSAEKPEIKALKALEVDPFCFEAIMILTKCFQGQKLKDLYFRCYRNITIKALKTKHSRDNAILFLNLYCDFLLERKDFAFAAAVQEKLFSLNDGIVTVLLYRYLVTVAQTGEITKIIELVQDHIELFNDLASVLETLHILCKHGYTFEALTLLPVYDTLLARSDPLQREQYLTLLKADPSLFSWLKQLRQQQHLLA